MSWLQRIRSLWRDPIELGDQADAVVASATARAAGRAARPQPRPRAGQSPEEMSHSSQRALSGYGSNPYDTYTWELHAEGDGTRQLKRAGDISRKPESGGDSTNPYDTGSFNGGWGERAR